MSDGGNILGNVLEELKDTGKEMGKSIVSVPKDIAKGTAEQITGKALSPQEEAENEAKKARVRAALQAEFNRPSSQSEPGHSGPEITGSTQKLEGATTPSGPRVSNIAVTRAERKTELGRNDKG